MGFQGFRLLAIGFIQRRFLFIDLLRGPDGSSADAAIGSRRADAVGTTAIIRRLRVAEIEQSVGQRAAL